MNSNKEIIKLIDKIVSNFDPTPVIVNEEFPLRWESDINVGDYDFSDNYLDLDKKYETSNGQYLQSVRTAIEINKQEDGSLEYWDGVYMVESHAWCMKLNTKKEFPSFSLINENFESLNDLKIFLAETY